MKSQAEEKTPQQDESHVIGRYILYGPIARGGMATVHFARLVGDDGFSRIVAAKRLHQQFTEDPDFLEMFRNEARIASRIHHPNVVPVLDLVQQGEEVVLVQEYVHGVPLDKLYRRAVHAEQRVAPNIVVAVMAGVLSGLHAAHETKDERGEHLGIVHRDVSPHNIVVGEDGVPHLLDFGIAKARSGAQATRNGLMKGKLTYMAPEQFRGEKITRKVDVYAAGVVMWELLTMRRLHAGRDDLEILRAAMHTDAPRLSHVLASERSQIGEQRWKEIMALEPIVAKMVASQPEERFATASEAMEALISALSPATPSAVAEWVTSLGHDYLERCQNMLASNEDSWRSTSKIPLFGTGSHPESGFKIATRDRTPSAASNDVEPLPRFGDRRRSWIMWGAFGLFILASFILVGSLVRQSPERVVIERQVVTTQAAPPPPQPSPSIIETTAPTVIVTAPPPKAIVTQPVQPKIVWKPAPPAVMHPTTTSVAPSATTDCDPPFYYEGTKKVFKPGCM